MNKISAYFRDSYRELVDKVTWPNWQQLQQTTMIVLGATIVITLLVSAMDFLLIGKIGSTETGLLNYFYKIF